ncbi:multidrug transporter [Pseudoalteromonas xiamenensis]|uniref:EamA family transporter n=1 Tax=Pseudoalteromonas xiamenensis TaxID=882626 RepID=UPI0035EB4CD1
MTWVFFTFLAAFSQAWRNALQSKLSKHTSVAGVTLARFLFAGPLAVAYLIMLYHVDKAPILEPNSRFMTYVLSASIMQIIATGLMVVLFKQNNYAIGAGLAKSEAIVAAILGLLFFGSSLSMLGWLGVAIGAVAVLMLSGFTFKTWNAKTAIIGLACGTAFALTSMWVREASIATGLPFPHSAAWVLVTVIGLQTLFLSVYLSCFEKQTWQQLWAHQKLTMLISFASCIGSIGWFSAMSLEHVAYVKTLGQIEVFFMLMISAWWLKEPTKRQDSLGLVLIATAAILVMLT